MYNVNYRKKAKILTKTTFKMNTNIRFSMKKPRVKVKKFFFDEHCRWGQFYPRKATWPHLIPKLTKAYNMKILLFFCVYLLYRFSIFYVSFCFFFKYEYVYHLSNNTNKLFIWINFIFLLEKLLLDEKLQF